MTMNKLLKINKILPQKLFPPQFRTSFSHKASSRARITSAPEWLSSGKPHLHPWTHSMQNEKERARKYKGMNSRCWQRAAQSRYFKWESVVCYLPLTRNTNTLQLVLIFPHLVHQLVRGKSRLMIFCEKMTDHFHRFPESLLSLTVLSHLSPLCLFALEWWHLLMSCDANSQEKQYSKTSLKKLFSALLNCSSLLSPLLEGSPVLWGCFSLEGVLMAWGLGMTWPLLPWPILLLIDPHRQSEKGPQSWSPIPCHIYWCMAVCAPTTPLSQHHQTCWCQAYLSQARARPSRNSIHHKHRLLLMSLSFSK